MKLADTTGMSSIFEQDPLHINLKIVDGFLGEYDWLQTKITQTEMLEVFEKNSIFRPYNHPPLKDGWTIGIDSEVTEEILDKIEKCFSDAEPIISIIVDKLRRIKGKECISNHNIKQVLMFIAANIDYFREICLKEKEESPEEKARHREITADWKPSW